MYTTTNVYNNRNVTYAMLSISVKYYVIIQSICALLVEYLIKQNFLLEHHTMLASQT